MHEYVLTLLAAAAVTYLLTPLVRRFAIAVGALHAARDRDVHRVPTPLLGGFAMYGGLAAGLFVASHLGPPLASAFAETNMSKGLLLAGGLVVVMGFVDDRWGMGALSKLAGQVAAGVILVWSGAEVTWLPWPYGGTLGLTSDQQVAVTILVVVATINAINFIDGLDGLAAGIVGIGAAAFFIYYYTLTKRLGLADQTGPALASAVLVGMCLGFLPHNFNPARIFMGDTGSMLLGLLLAYAPIASLASLDPGIVAASHPVNRFGAILPLLLPAAVLLIPYADLLMAVVRRMRAGMPVFSADKKHLQHRLLAIGHSHRASVLVMYLWSVLFAGSVVWLSILRSSLYLLVIVTLAAMLVLLLVSMPRLRFWNRPSPATTGPGGPGRAAAAAGPAVAAGAAVAESAVAGPAVAGPAVAAETAGAAGTRPAGAAGSESVADPVSMAGPAGAGFGPALGATVPGRGPTIAGQGATVPGRGRTIPGQGSPTHFGPARGSGGNAPAPAGPPWEIHLDSPAPGAGAAGSDHGGAPGAAGEPGRRRLPERSRPPEHPRPPEHAHLPEHPRPPEHAHPPEYPRPPEHPHPPERPIRPVQDLTRPVPVLRGPDKPPPSSPPA
jgi:UDP-GlcNAc:undecaprenyl-phosphate/decaprenyl-phosphate GlcNAc-1-phosphate transferase